MEVFGFALALLGFLLAAGVWLRSMKQQEVAEAQQAELQKKLERTAAKSKLFETRAKAELTRAEVLEKELAEAVARRDEKAMATAMWELELERSYRQWRDVIVPGKKSQTATDVNAGQQLTFAINQDVERLREEVGVSIRVEGSFDLQLEAEVALGMLRVGEELLALAAKQADEVTVLLEQGDEPSIKFSLDCQGWDGDDAIEDTELGQSINRMATKLDGWLRWERQGDDRLIATVCLPVAKDMSEDLSVL